MASAEAAVPATLLRVEVVYAAAPHQLQQHALQLPPGATVADALRASGLSRLLGPDPAALSLSLWGRLCDGQTLLRDRDRIELTRPLQVDPKEARRQRYRRDGVKRAPRRCGRRRAAGSAVLSGIQRR